MGNIYAVFDNELYLDGGDITMIDSGYKREYTFHYGAGDCPSGCIINYYWKFSVYDGCVVQFDTSYGFTDAYSGIIEKEKAGFSIYPNPASKQLNIETGVSRNYDLRITNLLGEIAIEQTFSGTSKAIDVSILTEGIYDVYLNSGGVSNHRKLVIY
ncbi:MAG: T9SS type A sorting domain-containing protein [Bacteroidetes bacterium]|nr:T9SS type A sorting domain-containing protein [Bacteroidota bacterium]